MKIDNKEQFVYAVTGAHDYSIEKAHYKGTDCGAYINFNDNGFVIGSIAEGADYETDGFEFTYPFTIEEFWDAVNEIETQAEEIWLEHNDDFDIDDNMMDTFAEYIK